MARVKPLAELIEACIGPAFAAQGFASTDILAAWPDIVGERLAPLLPALEARMAEAPPQGRGRAPESGTLVVRVEGVFALELQHLAPVVIQRINAHYGWACVGRIVMQQDRVDAGPGARRWSPSTRRAGARSPLAVSQIGDDGLREALDRLGTAVVAAKP